jgi:hypothetical protein
MRSEVLMGCNAGPQAILEGTNVNALNIAGVNLAKIVKPHHMWLFLDTPAQA